MRTKIYKRFHESDTYYNYIISIEGDESMELLVDNFPLHKKFTGNFLKRLYNCFSGSRYHLSIRSGVCLRKSYIEKGNKDYYLLSELEII